MISLRNQIWCKTCLFKYTKHFGRSSQIMRGIYESETLCNLTHYHVVCYLHLQSQLKQYSEMCIHYLTFMLITLVAATLIYMAESESLCPLESWK
jgi:hypothetical protein